MINIVSAVIYFYIYICVIVLLFNILYIFFLKQTDKRYKKLSEVWLKSVGSQMSGLRGGNHVSEEHRKLLTKKLKSLNELISYNDAVEQLRKINSEDVELYLHENISAFMELTGIYEKKEAMQRGYYAYLMSVYYRGKAEETGNMWSMLISYMDDSTIYCRENVLQAVYASGSIDAVEMAFLKLCSMNEFHHDKLLSDGLMTFQGDKERLALRLWSIRGRLRQEQVTAIVQFITRNVPEHFEEEFCSTLNNAGTDLELKLAILRYFRSHYFEPVHAELIRFMKMSEKGDVEIAALSASALERYPGADTIEALKEAVKDRNWYVRHNAASSLSILCTHSELDDVVASGDRFASDMMKYVLAKKERIMGVTV